MTGRREAIRRSWEDVVTTNTIRVSFAAVLMGGVLASAQGPASDFQTWLRTGDVAAITAVLDRDPSRAGRPDAQGVPPLFWVASYGQRPLVELLLARGADPNARSPFGTALHGAVIGGHPDVILALVGNGADVNGGGDARVPPLVLAARRGQASSASALLKAGASVDARDAAGNTALLLAASYGHESIVRALLARRADTTAANQYGGTALDVAVREGHAAVAEVLSPGRSVAPTPAPKLTGPFLGQAPPDDTRRLFAPGFVSTERRELNAAFTPDGRTFFFGRDRVPRGTRILMTRLDDNGWQPLVQAPFSIGDDVDMFVTSDGSEIYFCSDRPAPNQAPPAQGTRASAQPASDIWVARKRGDSWEPATWVGAEVNSAEAADYYPTLTRSGTLYFSSNRPGGLGENDIYRVRRLDGRWSIPENLGVPVNTVGREFDPFIAPDESYLIFASARPGGLGNADLYVSVRHPDGSWGEPVNLGPGVNSATGDYTPMLSPDGRYLFFTSGAVGSDDIYWVDARVIRNAIATMRAR